MAKSPDPLAAAAKRIGTDFDVLDRAGALGFDAVPVDAEPLVWLASVVHEAGLGLPSDPLRTRGWVRFGRPLADDEHPEVGDVVLATVKEEEVVGLLVSTSHGAQIQVGPDEVLKTPKTHILTARRPIILDRGEAEGAVQ